MIAGIFGNSSKSDFGKVLFDLLEACSNAGIKMIICDQIESFISSQHKSLPILKVANLMETGSRSDIIISIGGDGTMLTTASIAHEFDKPVVGVNIGKLGFLAEVSTEKITEFTDKLKSGDYTIEERMVLDGCALGDKKLHLSAINDFVIDKGGWPKMIEITISIGEEYVTTFAADGLIVATPTGSTGYSLSTGGPIVTPQAKVITISPISAHSLTMRPLVIDASQKITIDVKSQHDVLQLNNDGRKSNSFQPPLKFEISKNPRSLKLLRVNSSDYFSTLRNKLLWGLDVRKVQEALNNKHHE
jgi:NAD+ kinase